MWSALHIRRCYTLPPLLLGHSLLRCFTFSEKKHFRFLRAWARHAGAQTVTGRKHGRACRMAAAMSRRVTQARENGKEAATSHSAQVAARVRADGPHTGSAPARYRKNAPQQVAVANSPRKVHPPVFREFDQLTNFHRAGDPALLLPTNQRARGSAYESWRTKATLDRK